MNKIISITLVILLCTGCTQGFEIETVQQHYVGLTEYDATYKYDVDFGGIFSYTCSYRYDNGKGTLTVTSPEEIAGITAVSSGENTELVFENISINTYLPSTAEFSPVSAVHKLIYDLGHTNPAVFTESEVLSITFEDGEFSKKAILSKEDLAILSCEFFHKEDRILNITLQ